MRTPKAKKKMKKPRIKVASAKAKGRALQDYMCQMISDILNIPWGREDHHLIQPRPMGQKGLDVILIGKAFERFPFSIECKSSEGWALPAAIRQVRKNKRKDSQWLVVLKRKEFQEPVVVMKATVFKDICKKLMMHDDDRTDDA